MTDKQKKIRQIQKKLFAWYEVNQRSGLPWRRTKDINDLYRVTLSEIMLQQTNVPKVIEKYKAFLVEFPTLKALANAQQSDVLRQWKGLGYNRRALNLHKMAQIVVSEYGGKFPETSQELLQLPGIGPYSSRSVLAFGRNQDEAARDVNVDRVLRRLTTKRQLSEKTLERLAWDFLPRGKSRDWHEALMDFASSICTKRSPDCEVCPLKSVCKSYPCAGDIVKKKKEIGRAEGKKHIPRRIYRGRIVELLRVKSATAPAIGSQIKSDWNRDVDLEWLEEILATLAKEGMIKKIGKSWKLK